MHRLLLCYRSSGIYIFSLNKNRAIQAIDFKRFDSDKGQALACEFLSTEGEAFAIGYSTGLICLYKTETSTQKPYQVIDLKRPGLNHMRLNILGHSQGNIMTAHISGGAVSDIVIIPTMGKTFEKRVSLRERESMQDEVKMSAAGSFYLQTRYAGLEDFKFKKGDVKVKGKELVEMCKDKNRSVSLYQAQLLIIMTEKMQIFYVNLDTVLFSYISSPKADLTLYLRPFEPLYHHRKPPLIA